MKLNVNHKWSAALAAAVALLAMNSSQAQDAPTVNRTTPQQILATTNTITPKDIASRFHELMNLNFASEYVTPRGMIVDNQGLCFQPLLLTLGNFYKSDGFINSVDADGGAWADFSSAGVSVHAGAYGNHPKTDFVEVDPILGVSVGFAKNFTLGVTYTAFGMQVLDIGTSQHLETKLSFDDSSYLGAFALHPTLIFWQELADKSTDADLPLKLFEEGVPGVPPPRPGAAHPAPNSSFYFDLGVAPSYTFKNGIKLETPCRVLFPDTRFYGDYYAKSSFVGLWEIGAKGTMPLKFIPAGFGHWNFFMGIKFLYFVDDNLYNLNTFNATRGPTRDTVQGYSGVSLFF